MPFSHHWIMHVEAMQRIKNKFEKIQEILGEEIDEGLKILEEWRIK
ncbi:MAG: hypothetical protein J6S91_06505 [Treponema sp.]|nr:hypothetical protein [Treponema sp.]